MRVFKVIAGIAGMAAASLTVPAGAQEQVSEPQQEQFGALMTAMQEMFAAEPLAAEQEARLPAAERAVARVLPEGAYAGMMRKIMERMIDPMFDRLSGDGMPAARLAAVLGQPEDSMAALSDESRSEVTAILDPIYKERSTLQMETMYDGMVRIFSTLEPGMRAGLARAYAVRFSADELAAINTFFATPAGAHYASESMMIFTDPQAMAGVMQGLPLMLEEMPRVMQEVKAVTDQLPPQRDFAALSAQQRSRLAALVGLSVEQLEADMAAARALESALFDDQAEEEPAQ